MPEDKADEAERSQEVILRNHPGLQRPRVPAQGWGAGGQWDESCLSWGQEGCAQWCHSAHTDRVHLLLFVQSLGRV